MPDKTNSYHLSFLKKTSLFSGLDDKHITYFLKHTKIKVYDKGKLLFIHGEPAKKFYIMLNGWIKLFRETVEGEESVIALCTQGDCFSKSMLFENSVYSSSAQVIENSTVFEISSKIMRDQIINERTLAYNMLKLIAGSVDKLGMQIEHLNTMSTSQRVGCFILKLCETLNTVDSCSFPYDKTVIANYLGMKPETFSRSLKKLKNKGINVSGNDIKIQKLSTLKEYSCISCSGNEECSAAKKICQVYNNSETSA